MESTLPITIGIYVFYGLIFALSFIVVYYIYKIVKFVYTIINFLYLFLFNKNFRTYIIYGKNNSNYKNNKFNKNITNNYNKNYNENKNNNSKKPSVQPVTEYYF